MMRLFLKYGLFFFLILLIHGMTMQNTEEECNVNRRERRQESTCRVAQARLSHDSFSRLSHFYSFLSVDITSNDIFQVPSEKSIQLLTPYFRAHNDEQRLEHAIPFHLSNRLFDPISHYIYAFRRIII